MQTSERCSSADSNVAMTKLVCTDIVHVHVHEHVTGTWTNNENVRETHS